MHDCNRVITPAAPVYFSYRGTNLIKHYKAVIGETIPNLSIILSFRTLRPFNDKVGHQ
jgi:hypothetical protein